MNILPEQYRDKGLVLDVYHTEGKTKYLLMHEQSKKGLMLATRTMKTIIPEWPINGLHVMLDAETDEDVDLVLAYILQKPIYIQGIENLLKQSLVRHSKQTKVQREVNTFEDE